MKSCKNCLLLCASNCIIKRVTLLCGRKLRITVAIISLLSLMPTHQSVMTALNQILHGILHFSLVL
uniref:Putative methyltransferase PMT20 n=1 Tax=Rhizophora mucronata TaxID=61149 RepID=A0A2P2NK83_RHIMU